MSDITTWAVIPSRSRPRELTALLDHLEAEDVHTVVVDNGYPDEMWRDRTLITSATSGHDVNHHSSWKTHVVRYDEQPPHLYRMWNVGLDVINELRFPQDPEFNVIVLNDDALLPPGWVDVVTKALREHDVVAACSDTYGAVRTPTVFRTRDNRLFRRMCPWAFALRGETGLRADESFRWWWGDTDVDWRVREGGGLVMVPGFQVGNAHANSTTVGVLAEQAGRDRETFGRKWGVVPW